MHWDGGDDEWDDDGDDDWDGDGDNGCIWIVTLYIVQLYTVLVSFNWFIYY